MPQNAAAFVRIALSREQTAHDPDTVSEVTKLHPELSVGGVMETTLHADHPGAYRGRGKHEVLGGPTKPRPANNNIAEKCGLFADVDGPPEEGIMEAWLPLPRSGNLNDPVAEIARLQQALAKTRSTLDEARRAATQERFVRQSLEWAYEVEHTHGKNMWLWRLVLRNEMTDALMKVLSERRRVLDQDLKSRKLSYPLPPPGCIEEFHERSRRARDGDFRR